MWRGNQPMNDEKPQPSTPWLDSGGNPTGPPPPRHGVPNDSRVPRIKGYRILARLGRGGMGTVWRAVQVGTKREVALKLMETLALSSKRARIRFEREVELTARLDHPNIARVYESGLHLGHYYYAMELIKGLPLDQFVQRVQLPPRGVLKLFRTVCATIQYAHQHGVIHRDLKPSNILVTRNGQPHVLDFGLAKTLVDNEKNATVSGEGGLAGTLAYMAPEQAAGNVKQIDTRTDVYSLGVVLYRLLTGCYPHDLSGPVVGVLRRIVDEEARPPREARPGLDPELESILLKALGKSPEERYASAGELALDVHNYLTAEPLIARPKTVAYFLRKRFRKHRLAVGVAAAMVAGVFLLIGWGYTRERIFRYQAQQAQRVAQQQSQIAQSQTQRAEAALKLAQTQHVKAQQSAQQARVQKDLALEALNKLVFDVQEYLEQAPSASSLRESLLSDAIDSLQRLASSSETNDSRVDRSISVAYLRMGGVMESLGRQHDAQKMYDQALAVNQQAILENQENPLAQRGLFLSHVKLGDTALESGRLPAALVEYEKALGIAQQMILDELASETGRDLFVAYSKLGDVKLALNDSATALAYYTRSLRIAEAAVETDPHGLWTHRDLAASYLKIGDASHRFGDPRTAKGYYQQALRLSRDRLVDDPSCVWARRDQAVAYTKLGNIQLADGDLPSALKRFHQALELLQTGVGGHQDMWIKRDLMTVYLKLGDAHMNDSRADEAHHFYKKALHTVAHLTKAYPENEWAYVGLVMCYFKIGIAYEAQESFAQAVMWHQKAKAQLIRLQEQGKISSDADQIHLVNQAIRRCGSMS